MASPKKRTVPGAAPDVPRHRAVERPRALKPAKVSSDSEQELGGKAGARKAQAKLSAEAVSSDSSEEVGRPWV